MAEEASTAPAVEAPVPNAAPAADPAVAEPTTVADTNGETSTVPKEDEDIAGKQATTEVTAPDGETPEAAEAPSAPADTAAETPASANKNQKRKSTGGVPEHKSKKLNKKKSMLTLHLDCKPGDYYWAKLKGYPPWPAIICDEQMLPESLLASRPVSTARPDGSIRDDFKEGGKNAKERTYPIMFLSTNEFTWMINTSLEPLDPEQCKEQPKGKMTKALASAWQLAAENQPLSYFKNILQQWQEEEARIEKEIREEEERLAAEAEERAAREAEAAANAATGEGKEKKKKSRKSKGGDGDVDMEDAGTPKSAKKRKKGAESDAEGKPKKTPKVTKLNAPKTPNGDSSAKKSATKSKKKVVKAPKEEEQVQKEQLTEAQEHERREKAILYLRHRLQKGFLTRDQTPQESEMDTMNGFFEQLETHKDLEPSIIRATKVHKVLKAIVKLTSIPKEEEYNFKKRSTSLLEIWNKRMEADGDVPPSATESKPSASLPISSGKEESTAPETNGGTPATSNGAVESQKIEEKAKEGAKKEDAAVEEKAEEAAKQLDEKVEKADAPAIASSEPSEVQGTKDVEMGDAAAAESATNVAAPSAEVSTEAA